MFELWLIYSGLGGFLSRLWEVTVIIMTDQSVPSDSQPTPQSEGLFCPNCEYDLTGLTEQRCPECGEPFDPAELRRWKDPETRLNGPLLIDDPPDAVFGKRVFIYSIFDPRRLAKDLVSIPGLFTARRHSILTRAITALILCLMFITGLGPGGLFVIFFVLAASTICEVFIAKVLARYVRPQNVPADYRYRFWRTMCQCFSGYLCMASILFILGICIADMIMNLSSSRVLAKGVLILLPCLCFFWWWRNLGLAIITRGKPSSSRNLIVFLIPLLAAAGVLFVVVPIYVSCIVAGSILF